MWPLLHQTDDDNDESESYVRPLLQQETVTSMLVIRYDKQFCFQGTTERRYKVAAVQRFLKRVRSGRSCHGKTARTVSERPCGWNSKITSEQGVGVEVVCLINVSLFDHAPLCLADDTHLVSEGPWRQHHSSTNRLYTPHILKTFGDKSRWSLSLGQFVGSPTWWHLQARSENILVLMLVPQWHFNQLRIIRTLSS